MFWIVFICLICPKTGNYLCHFLFFKITYACMLVPFAINSFCTAGINSTLKLIRVSLNVGGISNFERALLAPLRALSIRDPTANLQISKWWSDVHCQRSCCKVNRKWLSDTLKLAPITILVNANELGILKKKRRMIYTWCRKKNTNKIFLRETHSTKEEETQWRNEWVPKV